jgi:hypothetical protein
MIPPGLSQPVNRERAGREFCEVEGGLQRDVTSRRSSQCWRYCSLFTGV